MSTQQGVIIIQLILSQIKDGNNVEIADNLSRLPLSSITKDKADTLLSWFLNQAKVSSNEESVRIVITAFDIGRINTDPLPAITNIFLNPLLSREILLFTISCFPEKTSLDFFIDLINMGDDMAALKIAGIITTILPPLSNNEWATLTSLTDNIEEEEYENQLLRSYFQTKTAETSGNISYPDWIILNLPHPVIPSVPEGIPTVKEAVDLLMENLKKQKFSVMSEEDGEYIDVKDGNQVRDLLISQYSISTIAEKIKMLSDVKQIPEFDDILLFQEFGPVNTMYTVSLTPSDPSHKCEKYGGCRMLLCTEFESVHTNGYEIDLMSYDNYENLDWFSSCDICKKNIGKRQNAIRLPLCHGGWMGCYCSFDCMNPEIKDFVTAFMVGRMKDQLNTIGIRNR
jgi:hypothetical protein